MRFLVIYDICDDRRLQKVAKIMEDFGQRVQRSKFEMDLNESQLKRLKERIGEVINPDEDGVKYIPICKKCLAKVEIMGEGEFIDSDFEFYVV